MVTLVGGVKFFFFKTERYIGWLCEHLTKKSLDFWQFLPQNSKKRFHLVIIGSQWLLKGHYLTGRSVPILNKSVLFFGHISFFFSKCVCKARKLFVCSWCYRFRKKIEIFFPFLSRCWPQSYFEFCTDVRAVWSVMNCFFSFLLLRRRGTE